MRCAKGMRVLPDHLLDGSPAAGRAAGAGRHRHPPRGGQPGADRVDRPGGRQASWVSSVCTGALLLHKAGPARGRRVATHHAFEDTLHARGEITVVRDARYVVDGNVVTSQGVSAGIDMALWLIGQLHGRGPRPGGPALHPVRARAALPGRRAAGPAGPLSGRRQASAAGRQPRVPAAAAGRAAPAAPGGRGLRRRAAPWPRDGERRQDTSNSAPPSPDSPIRQCPPVDRTIESAMARPEPGPAALLGGPVEPVEQPVPVRGRDPRAAVLHGQADPAAPAGDAEPDAAARARRTGRRCPPAPRSAGRSTPAAR